MCTFIRVSFISSCKNQSDRTRYGLSNAYYFTTNDSASEVAYDDAITNYGADISKYRRILHTYNKDDIYIYIMLSVYFIKN